jgi:hypothetical protein
MFGARTLVAADASGKQWDSRFAGAVPHDNSYYFKCMIAGVLSCGGTHTAICPLDVVKCNMQVRSISFGLSPWIHLLRLCVCVCVCVKGKSEMKTRDDLLATGFHPSNHHLLTRCLQTNPGKYKGLLPGLKTIVAEEGSMAVWKGWLPTAIGYSAQVRLVWRAFYVAGRFVSWLTTTCAGLLQVRLL